MLRRLAAALAALLFPAAALGLGVRAAMSHTFLAFEYARPGFPEDPFGFSEADRLLYGSYGLEYIANDADERYLSGLRLPGGGAAFRPEEVSHMADVKAVLGTGLDLTLLAACVIVLILLLLRRTPALARGALRGGAILTLGLMAALAVSAVLGFERFFAWVHSLFFKDGTWMFSTRDTLIRVYPEQFWMDAGILIALVTVGLCLAALVTAGRGTRSRRRNP
ncbi:TIGR01906 family membrane protein [Falsarthrobacter nasiphocae]|uniref:Integral membrane protein (TIGR01906 family) n=1 Tax=Falsarthrobacter nasiphocae TaxID=189863 RepID=A0AAE4C4R6_9MICC|nr:TIGR01906 family membrane protein [Falsarthrobacter nasiphocae]MDR6891621.1 integral membrane protein (TIGR01906 family) [Falsarthrobacter nasiphocae]